MAVMSEPVCLFSPRPGLLCGRGVIFSAVWECFRAAVMHMRSTCARFFSLLNYAYLSSSLHHFDLPHTCGPVLPPPPAPFVPVINS